MYTEYILLLLLLISVPVSLYLISKYGNIEHILHSVNDQDDHLVQIHDDFLPPHLCKEFSDRLLKHWLVTKNPLNEQFEGSYGIIVLFKRTPRMWTHLKDCDLEMIIPVLEKYMNREANAFVLNVLMIHPEQVNGERNRKAVGDHYDMTLNQAFEDKMILPRWVNALYLSLPSSYSGGNLIIHRFNETAFDEPGAVVKPKIGRLVQFRGDALHSVGKLYSESNEQRVSMILEQYVLPDSNYKNMPEFRFSSPPDHYPNVSTFIKHKIVESLYFLRFSMPTLTAFGSNTPVGY